MAVINVSLIPFLWCVYFAVFFVLRDIVLILVTSLTETNFSLLSSS